LAGGNETFSFGSPGTTQFGESTALGLFVFRLRCRDWGFMGGTVSDQLTFQWVQGSIVKERKTFAGCCFWEKMDQKSKRQRKTRKQPENTMCIQSFRVSRPMLLQKHYT